MKGMLNRKTRPTRRYCNCFHCIGEDRASGQNRRREKRQWRAETRDELEETR